jgi:hypothetical protein
MIRRLLPSLLICQGKYSKKGVSPELPKWSPSLDDFRFDHTKDSFPVCHYWVSFREIANSLTEQRGHKTFQISGVWADYGQSAPYPSLAVRARNGRVADHPEVALNSVCDHPAAAGIYPQSALALGTFA